MPALVAIAPATDANHPLYLTRQRINLLTTICGTVSAGSFGIAFVLGARHGYLVYTGILSAVLLRNQRDTFLQIGSWLKDQYEVTKEFAIELYAKKMRRNVNRHKETREQHEKKVHTIPTERVAGVLERIGAACLANCLVSGIAFGMASIGVLGDMAKQYSI